MQQVKRANIKSVLRCFVVLYFLIVLFIGFGINARASTVMPPENMEQTFFSGMKLSDFELPQGWQWDKPNTSLQVGKYRFRATFAGDEETASLSMYVNIRVRRNIAFSDFVPILIIVGIAVVAGLVLAGMIIIFTMAIGKKKKHFVSKSTYMPLPPAYYSKPNPASNSPLNLNPMQPLVFNPQTVFAPSQFIPTQAASQFMPTQVASQYISQPPIFSQYLPPVAASQYISQPPPIVSQYISKPPASTVSHVQINQPTQASKAVQPIAANGADYYNQYSLPNGSTQQNLKVLPSNYEYYFDQQTNKYYIRPRTN